MEPWQIIGIAVLVVAFIREADMRRGLIIGVAVLVLAIVSGRTGEV